MNSIKGVAADFLFFFYTPQAQLEKNIARLKQEDWFAELENDFRYKHLIWHNRKVKRYLAKSCCPEKLIEHDGEKMKFIDLLNYEHVKHISIY